MKNKLQILFILLFANHQIFSQTLNDKNVESLILHLEKMQYQDSLKTVSFLKNKLSEAKKANDIAFQSQICSIFSSFYNDQRNKTDEAETYTNQAIKLAEKSQNNLALALAHIENGILERQNENLELAIANLLKAEEFALKTNNYHLKSQIYFSLSSIYRKINDVDNQLITAKKCLEFANKSNFKNSDLAKAHFAMALFYSNELNDQKVKNTTTFNNGVFHLNKMIEKTNNNDVFRKKNLAEAYFNLAVLYFYQNQKNNKNIVLEYLQKADATSIEFNHNSIFCMSKLMQINYLFVDKNLIESKKLLKQVDEKYAYFENDYQVLNTFDLYNAKLAEIEQNKPEALLWYKNFIWSTQKLYNIEKNIAVKKAESIYINQAKAQQLLQTTKDLNSQRNLKYLGFALFFITGFGMYFLFKNFKIQKREQILKQQLLEKQKTEAQLFAKLKQEENNKIILENQFEQSQKEMFQKQLMASVLQIESKNKILINIKSELANSQEDQKNINRIINNGIAIDDDFENFKQNFENVYPKFFTKLQLKASGELTQLDLKYCAYINMGLSAKEIANLLHVATTSVRMARYRLKQKLALDKEIDLSSFINSIS